MTRLLSTRNDVLVRVICAVQLCVPSGFRRIDIHITCTELVQNALSHRVAERWRLGDMRRTIPSVCLFVIGLFDEVVVDLPSCHTSQQPLTESIQSNFSHTQRPQSREDPRRRRHSRSFCKILRYVSPGYKAGIALTMNDEGSRAGREDCVRILTVRIVIDTLWWLSLARLT